MKDKIFLWVLKNGPTDAFQSSISEYNECFLELLLCTSIAEVTQKVCPAHLGRHCPRTTTTML
jgi:hypothetical protein